MPIASRDFRELRLDRVSRDFGQTHALRDVTLTVGRGEFVALLGPSGCGKSTALNCIAGLLQLSDGAIWLDDTRIDEVGPEERGFGMVFQNYALFPHMTVRRNIGFGLTTQRRPRAEIARRVDEALGTVRLEPHADKLPGQLSGGQQQRVAIARAIVVGPPLVLMDEPLSNLDAKLRLEMRAEVRRIHAMLGCSTVYVTHDQEEALSLADRILVLIDGQTRQLGTPEELYSRPGHARRRRVHGLPQPAGVGRHGGRRRGAGRRRRRQGAGHAARRRRRAGGGRHPAGGPGADAGWSDRRDRGDRRVSRPRLLRRVAQRRPIRCCTAARRCGSAPAKRSA